MITPQNGIFALGAGSHSYLEFSNRAENVGHNAAEQLVRVVANMRQPRSATGGVNLVAGFRPELWADVTPHSMPPGLAGFNEALAGVEGFSMPATQHDLWLWIAAHTYDRVFDVTRDVINALSPLATLVDETEGWTYRENRDLTGFIDGTENPSLANAPEVVLIPDGTPGAGGSIVLVQKWVHNAPAYEALTVEEQERMMGRTKADSAELPEEVRGPQSHVSRTVIEENGQELPIFRRNTPFGTAGVHGTMFVGFSADRHRLDRMLQRMAGTEDGIRDALTRYATPLTGAYYFVPSVQALRAFADAEE